MTTTDADVVRNELFQQNIPALARLMKSAISKGKTPEDVMLVCIHVDDEPWTELADHLMPGHDWQQYRDLGQKPIARGSVERAGMEDILSVSVPGVFPAFAKELPPNSMFVAVMDAGGASVFYLHDDQCSVGSSNEGFFKTIWQWFNTHSNASGKGPGTPPSCADIDPKKVCKP